MGSQFGKTTTYRYIDELEQKGIRKYTIEKVCVHCQYMDEEEGKSRICFHI